MTAVDETYALEMAELLATCNFLSFATLQAALGLDYSSIIELKALTETHLRCMDDDIRLVSLLYADPPGFFVS